MAAKEKDVDDFIKCMRHADTPDKVDACETAFTNAGGTITANVTLPEGKVFSVPGDIQAFVTNQGKVF